MEYCCGGFKQYHKGGDFVLENGHFYLKSGDISHPDVPTFYESRLMKGCPFCGKKLGGKND